MDEFFVAAVHSAGGEVAPLSEATRGVIWLSNARAREFSGTLQRYPGIEWVQLPWAGVDAFSEILTPYAGSRKPLWTSAKGAYAEPVAEHVLALVLGLLREFPTRVVASGWGPKIGRSLFGLNVVIVGAGGIAIEIMRLLEPFRVNVTIVRRSDSGLAGAQRTVTSDRLNEVLPDADVVVVAAALTEGTTRLLGAEEFAIMKRTAVLINIARGGLVDTDALSAALASGVIAGAGLDVTDPEPLPDGHPLWSEPRAIVTCHSADTPEMTAPLLAERVKINVEAFLGHGRFEGVVDPGAGY